MLNKNIILFIFIVFVVDTYSQTKLIYPDNNSTVIDSVVNFGWNKDYNNQLFNLQISEDTSFSTLYFNISTNNFDTTITLNNNKKYYWRVNSNIQTQWSDTFSLTLFNINSLDSLQLWYNADYLNHLNDSSSINTWADSSSNNLDLLQSNTTKMPLLRKNVDSLNNHSTVAFDGINDFLKFAGAEIYQPINYFFFIHPYLIGGDFFDGGGFIQQFGRFTSNSVSIYAGSYLSGQEILFANKYYIFNFQFNSPISKLFINNNLDNQGNNGTNSTTGLTVGSLGHGGNNSKIDIAEVIVLKDSITDSLRTVIYNYLYYKYAPPVNLGYNINIPHGFCDTTINAGGRFMNYIWNTGDTTQTITINQSGHYSVTVTDIFGVQSSDSLSVKYFKRPYEQADSIFCHGNTLDWNAGLQDTNYTFLWNTGIVDSAISINTTGNYYVQITDTFGCVYHSDTAHITIDNYPITTNLGNDTSLCTGQKLYLQNGANETTHYLWSSGDTSNFTIINSVGDYSVTATNNIGCIATDTVNIQIHGDAPEPGFEFASTCLNDNTIFTDTSFTTDNSNIISWHWNLGNSDTSNIQDPQLQFTDTGNYLIKLTIATDSSCSNTLEKTIRIFPLPSSDFTNNNLCSDNTIYFTDNSTIINDTIASWYWNLGNGHSSTDTNTTTVYDTSGIFTVNLKTVSIHNCIDSIVKTINVKQSPHPNFTVTNTCVNNSTSFYNLTQNEGVWSIISHNWNFGNGDSSLSTSPSITYNNDTVYTVSLSTTLINGCSNTITKDITIYSNPTAKFYVDNICVNNLCSFIDSSYASNTISDWLWKIDTLLSTQNQNVDLVFTETGDLSVSLNVITDVGCSDFIVKNITVNPLPNVDFNTSSTIGVVPLTVNFSAIDSSLNTVWDLGDGNFAYDSVINHTYQDSGLYKILLVQETEFGCKDSASKYVKAVIPIIDLGLFSSDFKIKNNSLSISTKLINLGTLPINQIELFINVDDASTIKEVWIGTLNSGEVLEYNFASIYELSDYKQPEFICVTANPIFDIYTDKDTENNEECLAVNNEFNLLEPFPNPAQNNIYFHFIAPAKSTVLITITDSNGNIIKQYNEQATKGYNKYKFNVENIAKGNYSVSFKLGDNIKSTKFIVN